MMGERWEASGPERGKGAEIREEAVWNISTLKVEMRCGE